MYIQWHNGVGVNSQQFKYIHKCSRGTLHYMGSLDLRSKVTGVATPTIHGSRNSELVKVNPMNSS